MANPGVSMNIAVFKELNAQLTEVTAGTDVFKNKISSLMKELQGLSQMVATIPAGLNNMNKQMANMNVGGGTAVNLNAAKTVEAMGQPHSNQRTATAQTGDVAVDNKAIQDNINATKNVETSQQYFASTSQPSKSYLAAKPIPQEVKERLNPTFTTSVPASSFKGSTVDPNLFNVSTPASENYPAGNMNMKDYTQPVEPPKKQGASKWRAQMEQMEAANSQARFFAGSYDTNNDQAQYFADTEPWSQKIKLPHHPRPGEYTAGVGDNEWGMGGLSNRNLHPRKKPKHRRPVVDTGDDDTDDDNNATKAKPVNRYYSELKQHQYRDIVGAGKVGEQKPLEKTGEQIDKLTERLGKVDTTIAKVLSKELNELKKEFSDNSELFTKYNQALKEYDQALAMGAKPDSDEAKKLFQNLNDATLKIDKAAAKLADVSTAATQIPGMGGKPQGDFLIKALGTGAFAAATVANVTRQGFDFYKEMEGRDITAGREAMTGRGQLAQKQFGAFGEQFDLYNARNMMRWGGNVLTPGLNEFAGPQGFAKAKNKALEELAREQQLKEKEQEVNLKSGLLDTAGNLLATGAKIAAAPTVTAAVAGFAASTLAGSAMAPVAGTVAGGALGLYMIGSAVKDTITDANKVATQYQSAAANEMYGGRADTVYGKISNAVFGTQANVGDIKERTKARFAVEQANQIQDRARAYQDAELDRMPMIEQSFQKYQNLKQTRYSAMSQLGAFAGLPLGELGAESKKDLATIFSARDDIYKVAFAKGAKAAGISGTLDELKAGEDRLDAARVETEKAQGGVSKLAGDVEGYQKTISDKTKLKKDIATTKQRLAVLDTDAPSKEVEEAEQSKTQSQIKKWGANYAVQAQKNKEKQAASYIAYKTGQVDEEKLSAVEQIAGDFASLEAKKVYDQKMSDIIDRTMATDKKGNFTDKGMKFANLGIGPEELQQRAYQYQSALGIGQMKRTEDVVAGDKAFKNLNRMSIAGFGSFEQLAGNVTALSQISGGTTKQNEKQLEDILAKGVEKGFNGSRLSQSLIQSSAEIASSLNLRNVAGVTSSLLAGASVIGAGTIDERNMRDAAAGIQKYAQFTGQKEGPMAALRMAGILQSGIDPTKGAGILYDMNAVSAKNMQQQIEQIAQREQKKGDKPLTGEAAFAKAKELLETDPSKIADPDARALLRANSAKELFTGISNVQKTGTNVMSSLWKSAGHEDDLQARADRVKKLLEDAEKHPAKRVAANKAMAELGDEVRIATSAAKDREIGTGFMATFLSQANVSETTKSKFRSKEEQAAAMVDVEKKQQAGFAQAMATLGKEVGGRTFSGENYAKILASGGGSTTIDGQIYSGQKLKEMYAKTNQTAEDKEILKKVEEQAKTETASTLAAKQAAKMSDISAPPQNTKITGIEPGVVLTLAQTIATEMHKVVPKEKVAPTVKPQ
jgi:uncharacterized coiled-coil protein SlyX